MFSTVGDIMINVRGYLEYRWGYLEYRGRYDARGGIYISTVGVGVFSTVEEKIFCYLSTPTVLNTPHASHDIPHIHHDIPPRYSRYPPTFIIISPTVLYIPHGTQDSPHMHNDTPTITSHTLYRVKIFEN